jgi:hypothetical protein
MIIPKWAELSCLNLLESQFLFWEKMNECFFCRLFFAFIVTYYVTGFVNKKISYS